MTQNHMKIFWFNIPHKTLIDPKSLCISFDKIDEFITTRYLTLFGSEK